MCKDRKKMPKERSHLVPLAMKRKAGSHKKPYKSQRGKLNRETQDVGEAVSQRTFNPSIMSSNLIRPTIFKHTV